MCERPYGRRRPAGAVLFDPRGRDARTADVRVARGRVRAGGNLAVRRSAAPGCRTNDGADRCGRLVGGAAAGVFALSMTDVDEKMGLSNTAMYASMGLIGGPWGAAIGAGIGLTQDLAAGHMPAAIPCRSRPVAGSCWRTKKALPCNPFATRRCLRRNFSSGLFAKSTSTAARSSSKNSPPASVLRTRIEGREMWCERRLLPSVRRIPRPLRSTPRPPAVH